MTHLYELIRQNVAAWREDSYQTEEYPAIADYDRAIDLDPQLVQAYFNRGLAYVDKGDLDRAIDLDPQLAQAYLGRGIAYLMTGQYDQALADLSKTIEIDSSDATNVYN